LILYRRGKRAVFSYGFAKSERDNVKDDELEALKEQAKLYLNFNEVQLATAVAAGHIVEVVRHDEEVQEQDRKDGS
jgi:hypothetical protein